jgi:DNA-binding GntR family transcriptional regulator
MPPDTKTPPLKPILHNTMQEQVYRLIRQSLIDGQFKPGQILTIRDLAGQLGTSVMPVREALHKLTVEQVLDITPTRSVRVPVLTVEKFTEIGEVRILLESHITRLAAQRADATDIERIETANREFLSAKASRDPTLLLRRNREFHFAIYGAAHHTTLMGLIEPLWVRCGPCMLALFEDLGVDEIKKGASSPHRAVLQALKAGRETEAAQAIAIDIRATIDRFRLHVETVQAIDPSSLLAKPAKERA